MGVNKNHSRSLIYGSTALKHWLEIYKISNDFREPRDLDVITKEDMKNVNEKGIKVEFYWTDAFNYILENNRDPKFVDFNFLYTIKVSHAAWDINWDKTMRDINFLKSKGCKLDKKLYNLLYSDWEKIHGKKKVKMNVHNKIFFKENIKRKYDHDWLHEQFAFNERPMNERIRKDLDSPYCSEDLWEKLTHQEKIETALEELFVLTSERYLFVDRPLPINHAKIRMVKQMIISTTSGWFNLFLIENFYEIINSNKEYFKEKIKNIQI